MWLQQSWVTVPIDDGVMQPRHSVLVVVLYREEVVHDRQGGVLDELLCPVGAVVLHVKGRMAVTPSS